MPRYGGAVVYQLHAEADQCLQVITRKWVVGTPQHQRVHLASAGAKARWSAHGRDVLRAQQGGLGAVAASRTVLNRGGQSITGLAGEVGRTGLRGQQGLELCTVQSVAGCHHTNVAGAAQTNGRFERRLHAHDRQVWVLCPQHGNGGRRRRVARHHQRCNALTDQPGRHGLRACNHKRIGPLAVGCKPTVSRVDDIMLRQRYPQRPQHTQPANATVKNADRVGVCCQHGRRKKHINQRTASAMPLNSPVAMRSFHSAGPVMWALVPPESTATVTGMSTTSNS